MYEAEKNKLLWAKSSLFQNCNKKAVFLTISIKPKFHSKKAPKLQNKGCKLAILK